MQQQQISTLSPLPDIMRGPSAPPLLARRPSPPPPAPEFLIVGLFALRLTKRLIEGLNYYPGRDADIIWLVNFLAPYHNDYALAKISEAIKVPRAVMQMNPDQSTQQAWRGRGIERLREMTDAERMSIIDFCDAAGEWGSILPIPAYEAEKMVELADRRKIADLDEPHQQQLRYGDWEESHGPRQLRFDSREELQDQRQPRFEPSSLPLDMERPLQELRQPEREDRYRLHSAGTWRGDEYLLPAERQPVEDTRRRRRVSIADERPYSEERRH
ncbi:uncharacterized protein ALTATR162_LOCUS5508 [Alternaria atra]|uniref:Uncharacterized protein n=1 Tax=Alternaria atra TaxID=119953 RepID=A0A8J2N1R7_9PLEO|nr:uncharacterized protein ALTATR162_LOCUS5508 [Alternaria atra]CAG5159286.1 unnamed protein product [Alternaria atra]